MQQNNKSVKKIALFGTSADPPTIGHRKILQWLAKHYDLVIVWAADNPFKKHQVSLAHRNQMLELLIQEINSEGKILLRPDLSDPRTINTVNKAEKIWGKQAEFTLVIGSDLTQQILRWYRSQELLKKVKILIIPRPGYPVKVEDLEAIKKQGGEVSIANLLPPAVSSTAFREELKDNSISASVKNYIQEHNLYNK